MPKLPAIVVVFALLAGSAHASVLRIALTKGQATPALTYVIASTASNGQVIITLEVPRKQKQLDHLWRIDIVLRKDGKSILTAPLEMKLDGGTLKTNMILDPAALKDAEIWIRTGEHAPLAETIYAIDLGSYK
ncbi:MAG: hypothetical protein ABI867_35860 [Kofleriaceae bacterium]